MGLDNTDLRISAILASAQRCLAHCFPGSLAMSESAERAESASRTDVTAVSHTQDRKQEYSQLLTDQGIQDAAGALRYAYLGPCSYNSVPDTPRTVREALPLRNAQLLCA